MSMHSSKGQRSLQGFSFRSSSFRVSSRSFRHVSTSAINSTTCALPQMTRFAALQQYDMAYKVFVEEKMREIEKTEIARRRSIPRARLQAGDTIGDGAGHNRSSGNFFTDRDTLRGKRVSMGPTDAQTIPKPSLGDFSNNRDTQHESSGKRVSIGLTEVQTIPKPSSRRSSSKDEDIDDGDFQLSNTTAIVNKSIRHLNR
jgi:hypothetical protein